MEILKDQNMVQILGQVHKAVTPYFLFYAEKKTEKMNFAQFSRFCTDFEVFPKILSKSKIVRLFQTLSGFFESTQENQRSPTEKIIDEHLFVEALALTAFEIPFKAPQPSEYEKIALLMERLAQSQGPGLIQKHHGFTK
jgi:hypothetical protein